MGRQRKCKQYTTVDAPPGPEPVTMPKYCKCKKNAKPEPEEFEPEPEPEQCDIYNNAEAYFTADEGYRDAEEYFTPGADVFQIPYSVRCVRQTCDLYIRKGSKFSTLECSGENFSKKQRHRFIKFGCPECNNAMVWKASDSLRCNNLNGKKKTVIRNAKQVKCVKGAKRNAESQRTRREFKDNGRP